MSGRLLREPTSSVVRARADCVGLAIHARSIAVELGWDRRRAEELALVVLELSNNAVTHARAGQCELEVEIDAARFSVTDDGCGLPSWVLECHQNGTTFEGRREPSSRGLGAGLDSARRLSDELALSNRPGGGACVRAMCGSKTKRRTT